jgi:transcriptional regulator with XRE-family HTH domain
MDDQRVGRVVRALRRRRTWRQVDLAAAAGCSQNLVSLIERGHLDRISLRVLRRIFAVVDATALIELRWRGAAVERLMDDDHASLVEAVARLLRALGWLVEIEVTYSEFGERGSFDLLALHPAAGVLLVIEVKTDLPSAEATLRKLDEKTRLAATVAEKRFGWRARVVSRLLVLPEASTQRRRAARHALLFERALPARNVAIRQWLERPSRGLSGLWFFSDRDAQVDIRGMSRRDRIRRAKSLPRNPGVAA